MPPNIRTLLESFDALSEPERYEAAVEILRRVAPADGDLNDHAFITIANEAFAALDAEEAEAVDGKRPKG
jgi:hypothetical protein